MQNSFAGLLKPKLVEVVSHNINHSRVVIEPFERGFGHSLGNALRRVMLSSISGCAVTEQYGFPVWLEVDSKNMAGVFKSFPEREDLGADMNEQLVVELYSK